jgi:4-carboxymuconolactone decarboxylase
MPIGRPNRKPAAGLNRQAKEEWHYDKPGTDARTMARHCARPDRYHRQGAGVWQRPGLSPRDRSLVTISALIALYRGNELPFHMKKALENGIVGDEIIEVITHLAFYSGWPTASTALTIARQVFADAEQNEITSKEQENADA